MPYTNKAKANVHYFTNKSVLDLLVDIHQFYDITSRKPLIEKQLDSIAIEYLGASSEYIATVIIISCEVADDI